MSEVKRYEALERENAELRAKNEHLFHRVKNEIADLTARIASLEREKEEETKRADFWFDENRRSEVALSEARDKALEDAAGIAEQRAAQTMASGMLLQLSAIIRSMKGAKP